MSTHGLGRIHVPDARDANYPLRAVVDRHLAAGAAPRTKRTWLPASRHWLDQGQTPECVAFSWSHWYVDGPTTHATSTIPAPDVLYRDAQAVDGDPTPHDGTSVRAGAQALQGLGIVRSYHWAATFADLTDALLYAGPVVVGSNWLQAMFTPGAHGVLDVSGPVAGGHAYVLDAIDTTTGLVRIKNSWGRGWGLRGFAWIRFPDMQRLLADHGEACLAIEAP